MIVDVEIKPDRLQEFEEVINDNAELSRLDEGTYEFDVLRDPDNKYKFTFIETYTNQAALDFHKTRPQYLRWAEFKESGGVVA